MDLASFFCMVGRHGPAVALAAVAVMSVLTGFIFYRTVRGKRRKAADGEGRTGASSEGSHGSVESTADASNEGSSDVKQDREDVVLTDFKIRRRPAAAKKKPSPYHPLKGVIRVPESKRAPSDDTQEMKNVLEKRTETNEEKAKQVLPIDVPTMAGTKVEDDGVQGAAGDILKDVVEELDDDGSLNDPELSGDENHEDDLKVLTAECQDEGVITAEEVCSFKSCNERSESHSEEPVVQMEDAPVPSPRGGKSEEELPEMSSCTNQLSLEEKTKTNSENIGKDKQLFTQQTEMVSSTREQELKLTATGQAQGDGVMNKVWSYGDIVYEGDDKRRCPECGQEDGVLCDGAETMQAGYTVVAIQEASSSSKLCLSVPVKVDLHDRVLSGVNTDSKAMAESSTSSVCCQPQSRDKAAASLDGSTLVKEMPSLERELPDVRDGSATNRERFDKAGVATCAETVENVTASILDEDICHPHDRPAVPVTAEELAQPDVSSFSRQCNLSEKNVEFSDVLRAAPITSKDISPPMCPTTSQSGRSDIFPGADEESGISSLAVTPDLQDGGTEFGITFSNAAIPVMDCDLQAERRAEAQNDLSADDVASSVISEDSAGMEIGPLSSHHFPTSRSVHTKWSEVESFAINEDMFGHEIENVYHRVMDQFTAHISASVTRFTDEVTIQRDVKRVFEVVEFKEKEKPAQEVPKAREESEDLEKTEISIMEATMDYNEWITESNYQGLPWMNPSTPFGQVHTKLDQLPSELCPSISAVKDKPYKDRPEIPTSAEVKQTSAPPLVDENADYYKNVVAVQPMPQSVNVTFRVHYVTKSPYETVAVTGNQPELGNWKEFTPLERSKEGYWAAVVSLPVESHVEWKFVLLDKGGVCRWEECGNRLLDTGCDDDLLVHKWWGLL